ncbi:MAG: NADH-quinone oxidoreductase subunit M [Acidimicrobiia bacterium]|nr:NADH-quinone oxidoreductase subunit M [Acidimicrobiia bacterium]
MLTALVLAPVAAALVVMAVPSRRREIHLPLGVALSVIPLGIAAVLFTQFESIPDFQFTERVDWIPQWGISWYLGLDGISLPLVLLTVVLVPLSLAASFREITNRHKEFVAFVLLLEAGTLGVFVALDLFVFFVFFEAILIPMYFIIGIWGGERRIYAAIKFFLFTAVGSALLFAGIIALALLHSAQTGAPSFALDDLMALDLSPTTELVLFVGFALAFSIKIPVFPLHTWLPDAHTEAPTAGSVLLAGVMLKLGTYGLLRFNLSLFPSSSVDLVPVLATLAVIGIIWGAVVAIVQSDLKRLVAYTSVSHLGFIVLGTFALTSGGLQGAVIQNVNHGLTTGALFMLVGMLYDRAHTKEISRFGGLQKTMPLFAGFFLFMIFASIGLPGLNGFVGEFLILMGSYPSLPVWSMVAAVGVLLAAIYFLWAYERVFTGPVDDFAQLDDLTPSEIGILTPMALLIVLLGLYPGIILDKISPSTEAVLDRIEQVTAYEVPEPGRLGDVFVGSDVSGEAAE